MLFFVLWYFNIAVRPFEGCIGSSQTLHYTLNYLLAGLIPTWALFLLHARRDIASSMGLSHGFGTGLLSVETVAKKYHGQMTVETENGVFRVNVLLNL